jgi:hypothetical protein
MTENTKKRSTAQRKRAKRVNEQHKEAAIRRKYGPKRKAGEVTITSLETGEVIEVVSQWRIVHKKRKAA